MTEIGFYHLLSSPLERVLPKLLEKVLEAGNRAVVLTGSEERVEYLNAHLWAYDPASFLAHGSARDGDAEQQPIWLTHRDENPNGAAVLVLLDGVQSRRLGEYKRCLDLFDGKDAEAVAAARERWRQYQGDGHSLTYWRQADTGRWERQDPA